MKDDITLQIEGGKAEGLFVHRARVREGISRLPSADLEICSRRRIDMGDLARYCETRAAIRLGRTDAMSEVRTERWFSGIVTAVEHLGRVRRSDGGNLYRYRMQIRPNLVNLTHARSGFNYNEQSAVDVVKDLFDRHGINFLFDGRTDLSTQEDRHFSSYGMTDYEFLLRVLASEGLAFAFEMPAQGAEGVREPVLHVGGAASLACSSAFRTNGKDGISTTFVVGETYSDARMRVMSSWIMRQSIGVDRYELGFVDRQGRRAFGADGPENSVRKVRLNDPLTGGANSQTVGSVASTYLKAEKLCDCLWRGETSCIEAMPCCRLKVSGFYDNLGGDGSALDALVIASDLDFRVPLPSDLSFDGAHADTYVRADLTCVDCAKLLDDQADGALGVCARKMIENGEMKEEG